MISPDFIRRQPTEEEQIYISVKYQRLLLLLLSRPRSFIEIAFVSCSTFAGIEQDLHQE
jgi:hypothetical protein